MDPAMKITLKLILLIVWLGLCAIAWAIPINLLNQPSSLAIIGGLALIPIITYVTYMGFKIAWKL